MMRLVALATALLLPTLAAGAAQAPPGSRVGELVEIRWRSETSWTSGDGTGNASSRSGLVERVIAVRDGGVELEFDLPRGTSREDRAREWGYPVRVFRPSHGPLQLLNAAELEARVVAWLQAASWPRTMCGRWIFTWNAFKIECDPQSVIRALTALELPENLRDGAPYQDPAGRGPAVLRREARGAGGAAFIAEMEVDPQAVRREQVETDAVTLQIVGESPELRATIQARSAERISGTIRITIETDAAGRATRRTKTIELTTEAPSGRRETRTTTETVERRLVSRPRR